MSPRFPTTAPGPRKDAESKFIIKCPGGHDFVPGDSLSESPDILKEDIAKYCRAFCHDNWCQLALLKVAEPKDYVLLIGVLAAISETIKPS